MPGATLTLSACFLTFSLQKLETFMSVVRVRYEKEWLDVTSNKFNSQLLLIKLFWINLLCLHMHIWRFPSNCGIIFWRERKGFIAWRYCCIPDKEIANVVFSSHSSWISSFLSSTLSSLSWMFRLMFPAMLFWSDLRICSPCFSSFCLWYFWH